MDDIGRVDGIKCLSQMAAFAEEIRMEDIGLEECGREIAGTVVVERISELDEA